MYKITKYFMCALFPIICHVTKTLTASPLVVQTTNGAISGVSMKNGLYLAYKSIPYAEPPLGEQRFEAPIPHSNWQGTLEAVATAPQCPQWQPIGANQAIHQSEDCLYLNVFVPNTSLYQLVQSPSQFLPVMVFIHGGGFMWGSADFYGEEYLMETGAIILVTFNYRLGPLGFLSTEDSEITGNMGLKDQSLALQWVYENIAKFGGNQQRILLAGWSAGGASVHFHMVSQWTEDKWFSSAISFSGTALCPCHAIYPGEARRKARLLAQYMDCTPGQLNTSRGIKECLKSHKAADIVAKIPKFYKFSNHPFAIFGPVIENTTSASTFLTNHVEELMKAGQTKAKPWLITRTAEDGAFGTAEFLKRDKSGRELIEILEQKWLELAPILLFFNTSLSEQEQKSLAFNLKAKYFGTLPISLKSYKNLQNLFNEELSKKHIRQTVEFYLNYTRNAKAYGYIYDNPAPYGYGQMLAERTDWEFGTLHGDDVWLIFKTTVRQEHPFRADEKLVSEYLKEMLIQMAKTGKPTYNGKPLQELTPLNKFKFSHILKDDIYDLK